MSLRALERNGRAGGGVAGDLGPRYDMADEQGMPTESLKKETRDVDPWRSRLALCHQAGAWTWRCNVPYEIVDQEGRQGNSG